MRYFISAGEPSGDLHGSNLIAALKARDLEPSFAGFGGDKMVAAGCEMLYPLADEPVIGIGAAIAGVPKFVRLLNDAEKSFRRNRPDAVILIDNPGFNWHVARRAKQVGIPVIYFVPPQIWSWGSWRVAKMRRYVDEILCSLPFEEAWYHSSEVRHAHYVGHPFFDDLASRRLDQNFLDKTRERFDGKRIVALLPGSRQSEVTRSFVSLIRSAERIRDKHPDVVFLVAGFKPAHREIMNRALTGKSLPLEIHFGKTPEIISVAEMALAVSGSVSLELLYHTKPTVIVYRIAAWMNFLARPLLFHCPYITLVNLMAGRALFPEFYGWGDPSQPAADALLRWLDNPAERDQVIASLRKLKRLYAAPGATARAAEIITNRVGVQSQRAPLIAC